MWKRVEELLPLKGRWLRYFLWGVLSIVAALAFALLCVVILGCLLVQLDPSL